MRAIGLLASALAVALNALLQPQLTAVASDGTFLISFSPFSTEIAAKMSDSDHLYIAPANFSHGPLLPAWVAKHTYFHPFQID